MVFFFLLMQGVFLSSFTVNLLQSVSMKVKAFVAQSCPTHCDLMNCSPTGASVHEILQAGILEWVATPFSRGSSRSRD